MELKLNLGCGEVKAEGYVNIDRETGSEAYPLPYPDNHFDEVRSSHLLEHFSRAEVEPVLKEWVRVLKPGGSLKIAVPDFEYIIAHREDPKWQGYLFGGQMDGNDFHKVAFDRKLLTVLMQNAGLYSIGGWRDEVLDSHQMELSLNLCGNKDPIEQAIDRVESPTKIAAIMSLPRLAWTDNFGCAQHALVPLGINLFFSSGVFWGQCLTRLMEMAIKEGNEYIITIDYDSIFTRQHVQRLCQLMIESDADMIVPVQVRRENNHSMFTMRGADGQLRTQVPQIEFDKVLTPILTGHFGLTIIRVSALEKMPKPWFLAIPNNDGSWNDPHIDEDIYFWNNVEKSGLKVYLANEVRIGHLQNMIAWPEKNFAPRHQYVSDWYANGQPKDCGGDFKVEELT